MNRIYNKYIVKRVADDTEVPNTFPLKYDTDPIARIALKAYALAMKSLKDEDFYNEIMDLLAPFEENANKPSCPVCGSTDFTRFTREIEGMKVEELYCVCTRCGNMFKTLH